MKILIFEDEKQKAVDSLNEWYRCFLEKSKATTYNCFWIPFFSCVRDFVELYNKEQGIDFDASDALREEINKIKKEIPDYKICMHGVYSDMVHIKEMLPVIYHFLFNYLDYWVYECAFFGWDWTKDNGHMESQKQLTDNLKEMMLKMYAIVEKALEDN